MLVPTAFLLVMFSTASWGDSDATTPSTTVEPTTNPYMSDQLSAFQAVTKRVHHVLGMEEDLVDANLDKYCKDITKEECTTDILRARVKDFFEERNKSLCFGYFLTKKPCSQVEATTGPVWEYEDIPNSAALQAFGRKLKKFFLPHRRLTCLSANLREPSQFVRHFEPIYSGTNGPSLQNAETMHCLNMEQVHSFPVDHVVINIFMATIEVSIKNCHAQVDLRQCHYTQTADGVLKVPTYGTGNNKKVIGAFTVTLRRQPGSNVPCEMTTVCLTRGRELSPGQHALRGFKTTIITFPKRHTGRRLLSAEDAPDCASKTTLSSSGGAVIAGRTGDGPGEHITICNGSSVVKMKLGEEHGCYTVRKITSHRVCLPKEEVVGCSVEPELRPCGLLKCIGVKLKGYGMVKMTRGKTVAVHTCENECLLEVPAGSGNIQIDCPSGQQHFLESNIVDIDCPSYSHFNGLMLYICRMSHRPIACIMLLVWLSAGYCITCLVGYIVYYIIWLTCVCIKSLRRRRLPEGDICLKCEQKCSSHLDQELHDMNCSFNLCPYCANRLPEANLPRHVPNCPRKIERTSELDLYLDYTLVPSGLRFLLSLTLRFGVAIKRTSWFLALLLLLLFTIAPVQGHNTTAKELETGKGGVLTWLAFCTALSSLLILVGAAVTTAKTRACNGYDRKKNMKSSARRLIWNHRHASYQVSGPPPDYTTSSDDSDSSTRNRLGDWETGRSSKYRRTGRSQLGVEVIGSLTLLSAATVVLLGLVVTGAAAFDSGNLPRGIWEEEEDLVIACNQECYVTEEECGCAVETSASRKLLFFKSMNSAASKMISSHRLLTGVSIDAPWGALHVESTYKPRLASSNIELSWNSIDEQGDKIILSGKSTAILKLEEKTGLVWSLGAEQASEQKKLLVSIMDYTQHYAATFQYITGDRTVSEWPKATCTGDCPDRCGCTTSTCLHKSWPHSRNWRCNPTWCWGIGTGCTCCGIDVERPFNKFFAAKWSLEYIRTDALVCVEMTDQERHCDIVQAGTQFTVGAVSVMLSDPQNIQRKLPEEIMTIQRLERNNIIDIMHVTSVISAKNACKLQSCSHGSPGDMQILHTDSLIKDNMAGKFSLADINPLTNNTWMSWEGCDLDYFCTVGSWPSCTYTGINSENTDSFENLLSTEQDYTELYHFHSKRISSQGATLQLDLKARPNEGGGEITALINVRNLELHSKKTVLKGLKFIGLTCTGCYSCSSGISCTASVKLEKPDEFTVHLRSISPETVVSESSIIARRVESAMPSKFRAFSAISVDQICLEIVEKSLCKDCSSEDVKRCTKVELSPPKDILLEHKGTIVKHLNTTCTSGLQCWMTSTNEFFLGAGSFFSNYFGSWVAGLLLTLLPIVLLLVFFCYGDKLLKCFRCCRCLRGLRRRQWNRLDDTASLRDVLKRFSKSGEIFTKDSKDKRTLANMVFGRGTKKSVREVA
uniref:M polyprotein n=1 Tax=Meram virus TaxID=2737675 RepID=A0A7G7Y1S6_9VIRU|nr:glycoprotein precursor [Meram virus]QNH88012.1 glycoprotein precursor [Meram virus]